MKDIVLVATVIAFFAVCMLYVRACAAVIGPESDADDKTVAG